MYDDRSCSSPFLFDHCVDAPQAQVYHGVDIESPPVSPLDFPTPTIGQAEHWSNVTIHDHVTGRQLMAKHILIPRPAPTQRNRPNRGSAVNIAAKVFPNHAYLTKKRLAKSAFGNLRLCVVLRPRGGRRTNHGTPGHHAPATHDMLACGEWETTDAVIVLKSSPRDSFNRGKKQSALQKDAWTQVAAQQYVGSYHPHLMGHYEAFQDQENLYTVLPYCPGSDLYSRLVGESSIHPSNSDTETVSSGASGSTSSSSSRTSRRLVESHAREWFCQLLDGVAHLQKKGVCHGGICLENILSDADDNLMIGDFGLAIRLPYDDESNIGGGITDVSGGSLRRLIRCLVPSCPNANTGANPMYTAPELIHIVKEAGKSSMEECCFDGFSVDLWSLGIVLFVMLTGSAPFRIAHESDPRFVQICQRGLLHKLPSLQGLSRNAVHLLQDMMWANPIKRLSLAEIMAHPWLSGPSVVVRSDSFGSQQDTTMADHRPTKKRLHHLSYYDHYSFGGNETVPHNSTAAGQGLDRTKPLKAEERMASF